MATTRFSQVIKFNFNVATQNHSAVSNNHLSKFDRVQSVPGKLCGSLLIEYVTTAWAHALSGGH